MKKNQRTARFWMLALALLLCSGQLLSMPGAMAAGGDGGTIYYVKMQEEGGDDGSTGTTWDDAFATLQKALESAQTGDKIWMAKGTYYPTKESYASDVRTKTFQMKNGVDISGGYSGIGTERNVTDYPTVLSGDIGIEGDPSDNAYHIFHNRNIDQTAKLDGVTVTGGNASGYYVYDQDGGGMYNYQSSPTLQHVTFVGNTAKRQGGGMANSNDSSPDLTYVVMENNKAQIGGGMHNEDNSSPILRNGRVTRNTSEYYGGGINNYKSNPALTDVAISENEAGSLGGGMYNFGSSPILTRVEIKQNRANTSGGGVVNTAGSNPVLSDVKMTENEAISGSGGGMVNSDSNPALSDVVINLNKAGTDGGGVYHSSEGGVFTNVTISENTAKEKGGGVYFINSKSTLNHVEMKRNHAKNGGGIYNSYSNDVMTDVKISENEATGDGGGIYSNGGANVLTNAEISGNGANVSGGGIYNFGSNPALTNVTISGNEANVSGGGMYTWASTSASLRNSIVWGNSGDDIFYYTPSSTIHMEHSLLGKLNRADDNGNRGNIYAADPVFIDSAQGNYRLGSGSPAIDQGSPAYFDAGQTPDLSSITTDMEDKPRLVGDSIDMGAYEYQENEARLNSLLIEGDSQAFVLTPEFSSTVTSYRVYVNTGVTKIKLTPTLQDPAADVELRIGEGAWSSAVSGAKQELQVGNTENEIQIRVTAKDGVVKTYTVTLDSLPKPDLALSHSDWTDQDVTITVHNRVEGARLASSTNGQDWQPDPDPLTRDSIVMTAEGSYLIYIRQVDDAQSVSEAAEAQVRIDKTAPVITLNGDAIMSIQRGSTFVDPKAQVTDNLDPEPQFSINGTVDTDRLGEYTLTYAAVDHAGNQADRVTRTVQVVREGTLMQPVISVHPSGWTNGDVEVTVSGEAGATMEYSLDGQTWEQYVGQLTIKDEKVKKVYARQTDALQNVSDVAEAEIRIDKTAPVITLNGAAAMNIYRGSVFQDPGVTITDQIATGLAPTITGTVDATKRGTYILQYAAEDWAGNQAIPVERTVRVIDRPVPSPSPVVVPVSGITLAPRTLTLTIGEESVALDAAIAPSNATNQAVSWSSSNPSVAEVETNGRITAKKAGTATITVTTYDGSKTASSIVTVLEKQEEGKLKLEVSPASIQLLPGDSKTFKVYVLEGTKRKEITNDKAISYSFDKDYVSVKKGRVTAGEKTGTSPMTVHYRGEEETITITIEKEKPDRVVLEASESTFLLVPNGTIRFSVYAVEKGKRKLITRDKHTSFSVDDKRLVEISPGRLKAGKEEGETVLTIQYQGEELVIPVVISKVKVQFLRGSDKEVVLGMDDEHTLRILATMSNKEEIDVTERVRWSSVGTQNVVKVTEDGTLIPLKKGTANLSAKYGGRVTRISVLVLDEKKAKKLQVNRSSLKLKAEQSVSVIITALYEKGFKEDVTKQVKWSVEDEEIADVEDGMVTGIKAGKTTIRATYEGIEKEIIITVR
ncbi:immunoglobulin-like domain-containing protein [Brevibacillus nitrificans]|nr:immunoglobulin-like domain-containing protein [Brevibacillus nitrificans]